MPSSTDAAEKNSPRQWVYRNLTPWRIHACFIAGPKLLPRDKAARGADTGDQPALVKVLSIPALGEVKVAKEDSRHYNTLEMRRLGQIELRPAPSEFWANVPRAIVIFGWLAVALTFGAAALLGNGANSVRWELLVACVVAVPVLALVVAIGRELLLYRQLAKFRAARATPVDTKRLPHDSTTDHSLEGVGGGRRINGFVDGVPRHVAEVAVLIGVLVVSVIGLGVAIHLTTQLKDLLPIDYGALVRLNNPFEGVSELALSSPAFWQLLVGHIAQWVLVSIAALAPAAMYFQFDRERLAEVQRRWVQEVFRLDSTVRTVRDIEAKYGSQIESAFGELSPDSGLRLGGGRRSPVIVATILLVVGWFLVISTTDVPPLEVATSPNPLIGGGTNGSVLVWHGGSFPVSAFFAPHLSIVGYAFLGSYVFTLFQVLRSYQRRDLHPKSYNTIVVRILSAYALALVIGIFWTGRYAALALFFVGFTPESALVWLREKASKTTGVARHIPLEEPAPLTDLEGIDLYDRTRLAEEGINNVHALAHADLVELMSSTRIPAAELVDWTDQAILYLRVGGDTRAKHRNATGPDTTPATGDGIVPDVEANLAHLRTYGIRTATDLLEAYKEALRRGGEDEAARRAEVDALRRALDLRGDGSTTQVYSSQTIIDTLPDEEWFVQVQNWRASEFGGFESWYTYLDGHDWNLQTARDIPPRLNEARTPFAPIPMAAVPPVNRERPPTASPNGGSAKQQPESEPTPTQ